MGEVERMRLALEQIRVEAAKGAFAGPVRLAKIHGLARVALAKDRLSALPRDK
jgi:hypothetical protein